MVALPQTFKTEEVITRPNSNVHVPDGTYIGVIVSADMVESPYKKTDPQVLMLKVAITQGEHAHKVIEHSLSILDNTPFKADKPEWTRSRAAYGTLGQISDAFGMANTPADTNEIINKPIAFETATRMGKDKDTGNHKPEWDSSYIKNYTSVPANGVVAPVATAPEPTQEVKPAEVTPPVNNPFANN